MFDLEKAVRRWRGRLERGSSLSPRELDELEDHLRACVNLELELNAALTPARAFAAAQEELGEAATMSREFAKAGKPRWRGLLVAGWALFGVSFLLPALFVPATGSASRGPPDFSPTTVTRCFGSCCWPTGSSPTCWRRWSPTWRCC